MRGTGHGADYGIADKQFANVTNAKMMAAMAVDLLANGARLAREVVAASKPPMTRQTYLALQRGIFHRETYEA